MTAEEYYQASCRQEERAADGSGLHISGLSIRVFRRLKFAGYTSEQEVDWERLRAAVLDGSVWKIHYIGEAGVKHICQVLAARDGQQKDVQDAKSS